MYDYRLIIMRANFILTHRPLIMCLQLRGFEMLRAVQLDPIPFDVDRDLITPTFKLKRPQLLKHYKVCLFRLLELFLCMM